MKMRKINGKFEQDKKGFLLGEFTLKVLVAILCIVVLLFLLYKVYANFMGKSKLDQAKSTVDKIIEEINAVSIGVEGERDYQILNPKDWVLLYYSTGEEKPKGKSGCNGDKCLCICEKEGYIDSQITKCENYGICKNLDVEILAFPNNFVIDGPKQINIKRTQGGVLIL